MKLTSKKTGFTLVELLVVIGIIALLISILLPSLNKARETANRVKCQSNLSQMGKALLLYSNENKGAFPRTKAGTAAAMQLDYSNGGAGDTDPFVSTTVAVNSIPASMFLLIRTQDMTTEVFTCPSGTAEKDLMNNLAATSRSNFTGDATGLVIKNVSYSFLNVFPTTTATGVGYKTFITAFSSDFAIAADLSPGSSASKMGADGNLSSATIGAARSIMIRANSKNHDQDGQNVLYADGHAEFQQTALCGTQNDNIYTANAGTSTQLSTAGASVAGSEPKHAADSVLAIDMVNTQGP